MRPSSAPMFAIIMCLILTSCAPTQAVPPQVAQVIRSGRYRERVEVQTVPIYNCKNNAPVQYTVHRDRSLENSIELTFTAEVSAEVQAMLAKLRLAVGAAYGTTQSTTITDSSGLVFTIEPNTYPVYSFAWRENWEEGQIIVSQNGKDQTIEYSYLKNAQPQIQDIRNIGCDPAQLAMATAEARNDQGWTALYQQGVATFESGDYALSAEQLTEAIRLLPSRSAAYYYRGLAYSRLGDLLAAINDQSKAIELASDFALAYVSRGDLLAQQGQFDQAIGDYDKAIALDPANTSGNLDTVYFQRGIAYLGLNDHGQALTDLSRAMTLGITEERRDQMIGRVMAYGRSLMDKPDHVGAEAVFRAVRLTDGSVDNAVFWLAWALYEQGKFDDAMGHFDLCLARFKDGYSAGRCHAGKGFILHKQGALVESQAELEMALSIYPDQKDVAALLDQLGQ